ncbi:hypothetical protein [Paenibacillus spongiae]|uniref:Methyltransferase n=1 Tax=Paenibacillus spongiae TaxID=2909671 RepID=A0ABY5S1D8_9BACL|nr:hypothetical protein [Paenibacillus spongiae]UVI27684.1 hypothetical protein L1F29_19675 [Paenibacillus spongiae]
MSSRSWERKVRKNQTQLNKQRKKQGQAPLNTSASSAPKMDVFKGRSIVLPVFLILFISFFITMSTYSGAYKQSGWLYWVTIACYILMAVMFILRRPYLAVGKDFVKSRRFGGDKTLYAGSIKAIGLQSGSIVIEQVKGTNWVFTRLINRYPTDEMAERLRAFAAANNITINEK